MEPLGGKPVCGGSKGVGEYDLGLHVAALFLVLAASIFGAGFPVVAKKVKWVEVPAKTFFICKHFGTGVLVATAFVHLLPTAFGNLMDPCLPDLFTDKYPAMPGVIMMGSMFCLFVIEMYLNGKLGGHSHSHGGPMGFETRNLAPLAASRASLPPRPPGCTNATEHEVEDVDDEKMMAKAMYEERMGPYPREKNLYGDSKELADPSEMPPWFVVFYEQYVRHRLEMMNTINLMQPSLQKTHGSDNSNNSKNKRQTTISETPPPPPPPTDSPYLDVETGQAVDPAVYHKLSLNITLLEGGILFHSVFVGMTVSITAGPGFLVLLVAILFHQMFEGLGLGSRIAEVPYRRGSLRPWVLVVAFGTTAPVGQAIGLVVRDSYDPGSALGLIVVGVFNAISSGLLLYAALVDLMVEDFLSEEANRTLTKKDRILAFLFLILGAISMSIVGAFA
ncbi:Zinc/iron permease [Parathielavia hyrcaniae]|uniref:Zinc/iron permease n=1 Tax=Parathielavia hyrcaniae TaxID=113614 RepID=A0AAN6Q1D9_9PEZI|nr:Zinc/iron permease [Parathielavia hyrcaniae]